MDVEPISIDNINLNLFTWPSQNNGVMSISIPCAWDKLSRAFLLGNQPQKKVFSDSWWLPWLYYFNIVANEDAGGNLNLRTNINAQQSARNKAMIYK